MHAKLIEMQSYYNENFLIYYIRNIRREINTIKIPG
jgi:hypothetical protein